MSQGCSVRILDEVGQVHCAFAIGAKTTKFSSKSEKHRHPVATGVSFGKRAANRTAIPHLNIGNSRSTVMENGNFRSCGGCLDLRVPGQCAEVNRAIVFL